MEKYADRFLRRDQGEKNKACSEGQPWMLLGCEDAASPHCEAETSKPFDFVQ